LSQLSIGILDLVATNRGDRASPGPGAAFLLTQLGTHAAQLFAERVQAVDLTPAQVGLLRAVAARPGQSQRELADLLGALPSRLVALVDELESRGLVERRTSVQDRRHHALHLTPAGGDLMRRVGELARAHDDAICAGLSRADRETLRGLLQRLADAHGLTPGVHPGFRRI
jgi:DNA-binding MarR family transcriptional regulator